MSSVLRRGDTPVIRWPIREDLPFPRTGWNLSPRDASGRRLAAKQVQNFAGDVAGVGWRREKYEGGRNLLRLRRALHRHNGAELGRLLGIEIGRIQRCPHGSGRDAVHANSFGEEVLRERFREGRDGSLRRRVVEQLGRAVAASYGAAVEDHAAGRQVRQRGAGHVEVAEDVRAERALELLIRDVEQRLLVLLVGGVVDQDVELAQLAHGPLHRFRRVLWIGDVARQQDATPALAFDRLLRLLRVFVLAQVADGDVRAFTREQDRDCAADPRVTARDQGDPATQFVRAAIRRRLVVRPRSQLVLVAWLREVLLRERRLGIAPRAELTGFRLAALFLLALGATLLLVLLLGALAPGFQLAAPPR